jgi:8-oxo-dGTP pyrophosphatase MutT (NUDIX family)
LEVALEEALEEAGFEDLPRFLVDLREDFPVFDLAGRRTLWRAFLEDPFLVFFI